MGFIATITQRFRMIFESAIDGILITDREGNRFLNGNPAADRMLGYGTDALCRLGLKDLHREEDLPSIRQRYQEIRTGQAKSPFEMSLRKKDGSFFFVEATGFSIMIEESDCVGIIFRDITERKTTEQRLRDS